MAGRIQRTPPGADEPRNPLVAFAGLDNPTSNDKTREALGWEPTHAGWVEEVENGHYFA